MKGFITPPKKHHVNFDTYMDELHRNITTVQLPENAEAELSSLQTAINKLIAALRDKGIGK